MNNNENATTKKRIDITIRFDEEEKIDEKLERLLEIYNTKTNSSMIKILIEAEMRRQGF